VDNHEALWEFNPATTREIYEMLPEDVGWAYTTVKTMLSRLVIKNAVSEQKQGTCFISSFAKRNAPGVQRECCLEIEGGWVVSFERLDVTPDRLPL